MTKGRFALRGLRVAAGSVGRGVRAEIHCKGSTQALGCSRAGLRARQHLHASLRRPSARRHDLAAVGIELGPEPEGPVRLCWRAFPHVKATQKPERCVRPAPAADAGRPTGARAPDHAGHAPRAPATPARPGAWRVRPRRARGRAEPRVMLRTRVELRVEFRVQFGVVLRGRAGPLNRGLTRWSRASPGRGGPDLSRATWPDSTPRPNVVAGRPPSAVVRTSTSKNAPRPAAPRGGRRAVRPQLTRDAWSTGAEVAGAAVADAPSAPGRAQQPSRRTPFRLGGSAVHLELARICRSSNTAGTAS